MSVSYIVGLGHPLLALEEALGLFEHPLADPKMKQCHQYKEDR